MHKMYKSQSLSVDSYEFLLVPQSTECPKICKFKGSHVSKT